MEKSILNIKGLIFSEPLKSTEINQSKIVFLSINMMIKNLNYLTSKVQEVEERVQLLIFLTTSPTEKEEDLEKL